MADAKELKGWKKTSVMLLLTVVAVVIGCFLYSIMTRNVEVDDKGKPVTGGKNYKTKFVIAKK
jgi:hypothetical protein